MVKNQKLIQTHYLLIVKTYFVSIAYRRFRLNCLPFSDLQISSIIFKLYIALNDFVFKNVKIITILATASFLNVLKNNVI